MPAVARHRRSVGVEVLQEFFFRASQPFQKLLRVIDRDFIILLTLFTLYFVSGEESLRHSHHVHGSIFRHAEL